MGNKNLTLRKRNKDNARSYSQDALDEINIICLDATSNDGSASNLKFFNELRKISHSVRTFVNLNVCEEFLKTDVNNKEIIFLIVSGTLGELFIPRIHDLAHIDSIYLHGQHLNRYKLLENKYSKLKGHVFKKTSEICHQLEQDIRRCQNDLIPIHLLDSTFYHDQLNQLEPNFMYSQLLKETLINMKYDDKAKKNFIEHFIRQSNYAKENQIDIIAEFESKYEKHSPIWWYSRECFVYEMLNKALRTGNVDTLIQMGFFIQDLHRQIEHLYSIQKHTSMIVYRGQGMTNSQFEKLCQCKGGLISFHNFLSTSLDKNISLAFARSAIEKPDLRGIVFRMQIDSKVINISNPYASLANLSYFENSEKEILFSTHTVFRIEDIRPMKDENKIWQVYLRLTTYQDDAQLEQLTRHLRQEVQSSSNPWENLAKLMLMMGEFNKAQEIYENILEKTLAHDNEQLAFIYHQLGCVHNEKQNINQALQYFQKSLDIKVSYLPNRHNDPQLADTYSNIGSIYHVQGKLDYALLNFQYALNTNTTDQRILASLYNNIGMVLKRQGHFHHALQNFERSLQIDSNYLPPTHPDLAKTYANIGRVYYALKDYLNASLFYKKSLDIRRLSLPQNHPSLLLAIANYQQTALLLKRNTLPSSVSAPVLYHKQSSKSKLSRLSDRIRRERSSDLVLSKGK